MALSKRELSGRSLKMVFNAANDLDGLT